MHLLLEHSLVALELRQRDYPITDSVQQPDYPLLVARAQ